MPETGKQRGRAERQKQEVVEGVFLAINSPPKELEVSEVRACVSALWCKLVQVWIGTEGNPRSI